MSDKPHDLMTPAEVAALFRVNPSTVSRWADAGRLNAVVTPSGRSLFWRSEVEARLNGGAK